MIKTTKNIAFIALLTAILTICKMALGFIPNVEVVTLILVTSAMTFGIKKSLLVSLLFCTIQGFIFGFDPNILCYYIHWDALVLGCIFLKKAKHNELIIALYAAFMSFLFGVQSSATAVLLSGGLSSFLSKFTMMYISGWLFYTIHIVSNFIIFLVIYKTLFKLFSDTNKSFFMGNS